ncbi:MAG: flippase-like domain-containing protein [Bifidobacteriaceae bacterium]|nr:flippase-like domain-containing protein [Bifidobacteriaceae bacterium]
MATADDVAQEALARPQRSKRAAIVNLVRWLAIAAVVGAAVWAVASHWSDAVETMRMVHPASLALAFVLVLAGLVAGTASWQTILDGLGEPVGVLRGYQVCLVGQLGKYVPGSVWAYLLQMELGRRYSIARARVLLTSLFAAGIGVVSSLVLGLAALPEIAHDHPSLRYLYVLIPFGLVFLHPRVMTWCAHLVFKVVRKPAPDLALRWPTVLKAFGWAMASYALYGAQLWILTNSIAEPSLGLLVMCIGASGLGMTAGLFAFFLPSGLGAREAVVIAVLATTVTVGQATTLGLGSRILFTVGDLAIAGVAAAAASLAMRKGNADTDPGGGEGLAASPPAHP